MKKGATCLTGGKKLRKILIRFLEVLISAALITMLTVSLILAKPQEENTDPPAVLPSSETSTAVSVENETDLPRLISSFPAPVLSFLSGSGMTFVSAASSDAAVSGGFGRIAVLNWQTPEGDPVTLQSIWPADALDLLEDGYHFMPYAGPALSGSTSVRMENDSSIRLHMATDKALYIILLPRRLNSQVNSLCRSLQLFTANPQEDQT